MTQPKLTVAAWRRIAIDASIIIVSILAAFAIDAWWADRQETHRRNALIEDLRSELISNAVELERILKRQRLRSERLGELINALAEQTAHQGEAELRELSEQVLFNPSFDPSWSVLNLLVQSGNLLLIENQDVRSRLAQIQSLAKDFLSNQGFLLQTVAQPAVLYGTGSIVFAYPVITSEEKAEPDVLNTQRDTAVKYFYVVKLVTGLGLRQGNVLLNAMKEMIQILEPDSNT